MSAGVQLGNRTSTQNAIAPAPSAINTTVGPTPTGPPERRWPAYPRYRLLVCGSLVAAREENQTTARRKRVSPSASPHFHAHARERVTRLRSGHRDRSALRGPDPERGLAPLVRPGGRPARTCAGNPYGRPGDRFPGCGHHADDDLAHAPALHLAPDTELHPLPGRCPLGRADLLRRRPVADVSALVHG